MKQFMAFLLFCLLTIPMNLLGVFSESVFAQTAPVQCDTCTFSWDANTEPDMKEYRLYIAPSGTAIDPTQDQPAIVVPHVTTQSTFQVPAQPLAPGQYVAGVTAVDQAGNQSGLSATVEFVKVDRTPPTSPQNFSVTDGGQVTVN